MHSTRPQCEADAVASVPPGRAVACPLSWAFVLMHLGT